MYSNKELLKRSILQKEYSIETTDKIRIVDAKRKNIILEISKQWLGIRGFPKLKIPDEDKIQLHYTKRDDQVFKLVDGPVYDLNNINKFIEDMKSCLSLSQEGFNAIIVAFTLDRAKDCNSLINMLHGQFNLDMNYLIPVNIIHDNITENVKSVGTDYQTIERICGERLMSYNIEDHPDGFEPLFSILNQMQTKSSSHVLCINKERYQQDSNLEELLKEMCLLLELCLCSSKELKMKSTELVEDLIMLWGNYQNNYKEELDDNKKDIDDISHARRDRLQVNKKQYPKMDTSVQDDVTHFIECLRHIYVVDEPMKRCKEILIGSFEDSYQSFHDWYVRSITQEKENMLDSNLKMRLSKVMST